MRNPLALSPFTFRRKRGAYVPPVASAPVRTSSPSISPASGDEGQVYTITPSTFSGYPVPIISGVLLLDAVDVTGSLIPVVGGYEYTSTTAGSLLWTDSATNSEGTTVDATATATVLAIGGVAPYFVSDPTLIGEAVSGGQLYLDPLDVDGSGTITATYQWVSDQSGVLVGETAPDLILTDAHYGETFHCAVTLTSADGTATANTNSSATVGKVFAENWSEFGLGATHNDLIAGTYTRNNAGWLADVETSLLSTSGLALRYRSNTNVDMGAYRTEIDAFGLAHSFDVYDELFMLEILNVSSSRFYLRSRPASGSVFGSNGAGGVAIRLGVVRHQLPGEDPANAVGTSVRTLTVGSKVWIRQRIEGAVSKVKIWDLGVAEPALWNSTRTHSAAMTVRGPMLGVLISGQSMNVHYYSCAFNDVAPFWNGFVAPPVATADPMVYTAPATGTTASVYAGTATFTFEDI